MSEKIKKSDAQWKEDLSPEQFLVTRKKGTERAFSGKYCYHDEKGMYVCVCCGQELFRFSEKFDSGTGWPSFWEPVSREKITENPDHSHGMARTEVLCSKCDAHLGHVFPDGPEPTGLRYCINSVSLDFKKEQENNS